jgi:hypothetical protein
LIGKRPVKSADAHWDLWRVKEWLSREGSKGSEETGANSGMRDRSCGVLFVPLSFLVFLVLGDGDTGDVEEGVGGLHVMNSSHELHVMNSSHE